ncbi:aspartic proteinase nepenthesin-1-like [Tripterygium wilfordii]|uniref:Aspartic proteinase nepenthesin-1-like n=1 Tax=Tripterygium wilfordii TaxID=458696 RepID=A0A7J7DFL4_TRIWF|nr:aspartic proteinase nepenthesin-1-like [Tripterygium wilfordii]KAF5745058.1 aspartic proteinase nepenthesin-1-like [Tripterygium wilfordii]
MASNPSFSSVLLTALLATAALFASSACSTYLQAQEPSMSKLHNNKGFRVKLEYVKYSGKNLSRLERVENWIKPRRHSSLQKINGNLNKIFSSIRPGDDMGDLFMELSIGTPPKTHSMIMDTGSDLIWIGCDHRITSVHKKKPNVFYTKDSLSYSELPCSSGLCKQLPDTICGVDYCEYNYSYGGGDFSTRGILARENLTFGDVTVPDIAFGCGADNAEDWTEPGSGIVGLGRGVLSLVLQLKETKFGYCLPSMADTKSSGALLIGELESLNIEKLSGVKTTPLIRNQLEPSHYYLSLEGISIGKTKLPIKKSAFELNTEDGSGGLYIDSGTPITRLEKSAYDLVKEELIRQINLPVYESEESDLGFDLCFKLQQGIGWDEVEVPEFRFHFDGADLDLGRENYMIEYEEGQVCLAMLASHLMASIFGSVQQQNLLVIHNLGKETLSFVPTQCDQL